MMEEMNDVNDFMAKFDNGFEIKWGIAIDPELGKKVKVTILATGFGISDVDGMNSHIGKKHVIEDAEQQEKEALRNERRDHYYTPDGKTQTKRRPNIFIFNGDSLDNDEVILAVENTPTYKRSKQKLNEIRSQAVGNEPQNVQEKSETDTSHGIISFV